MKRLVIENSERDYILGLYKSSNNNTITEQGGEKSQEFLKLLQKYQVEGCFPKGDIVQPEYEDPKYYDPKYEYAFQITATGELIYADLTKYDSGGNLVGVHVCGKQLGQEVVDLGSYGGYYLEKDWKGVPSDVLNNPKYYDKKVVHGVNLYRKVTGPGGLLSKKAKETLDTIGKDYGYFVADEVDPQFLRPENKKFLSNFITNWTSVSDRDIPLYYDEILWRTKNKPEEGDRPVSQGDSPYTREELLQKIYSELEQKKDSWSVDECVKTISTAYEIHKLRQEKTYKTGDLQVLNGIVQACVNSHRRFANNILYRKTRGRIYTLGGHTSKKYGYGASRNSPLHIKLTPDYTNPPN